MTKKALVTGATSGIGRGIVEYLVGSGYFVYAIGRDFCKVEYDANTEKITLDLSQSREVEKRLSHIKDISLLINCAGFGLFTQHEDIPIDKISKMIDINLKAPIVLSKIFLKSLKQYQGTIINITSIEATRSSKHSATYSATKSGLRAFGLALFEEVRKNGVKVVTINPDITKTNFFDNLTFTYNQDDSTHLLVDDIVNSIDFVLNARDGIVITELTIRGQKFMIDKK